MHLQLKGLLKWSMYSTIFSIRFFTSYAIRKRFPSTFSPRPNDAIKTCASSLEFFSGGFFPEFTAWRTDFSPPISVRRCFCGCFHRGWPCGDTVAISEEFPSGRKGRGGIDVFSSQAVPPFASEGGVETRGGQSEGGGVQFLSCEGF